MIKKKTLSMPGNHVTKKHKFVDPIFRGFDNIYSCCLECV